MLLRNFQKMTKTTNGMSRNNFVQETRRLRSRVMQYCIFLTVGKCLNKERAIRSTRGSICYYFRIKVSLILLQIIKHFLNRK